MSNIRNGILFGLALVLLAPAGLAHAEEMEAPESALERRRLQEELTQDIPFVITPHRINYLLPAAYGRNFNVASLGGTREAADRVEVKFQFSFKLPLAKDIFHNNGKLYFAYTNLSFWQAYNQDLSSPFRETNHEPELFLTVDNDWTIFGLTNRANAFGLSHQSNGRSGLLSRSWNRIYGLFLLDRGNFLLVFKPWYRIPEADKSSPTDTEGDDNPDIDRYLGYGEIHAIYKWRRQTLGLMLRNNLRRGDNKGAVQLDWTFSLGRRLKGYVQVFNGYGESLIDYDRSVNRFGVGVLLTDWL